MLTINSLEQLEAYERHRVLVGLFLDNGYSDHVIATVMSAKHGFDANVRSAWHLLVPYRTGFAVDSKLSTNAYDIELARTIINDHGIPNARLPVLLFENYDGDGDAYLVSLAGQSDAQIIRTIGDIADIATREYANGRKDPAEFRSDVTRAIKAQQRLRAAISFARRGTSSAIGLLGIGAALGGGS
ncbi:hypothetical protein [Rhizobium sp. BK376]|uniref:hypothetical protein n=1 Tax=Rhizobium sp. BK376 TaxID=2512149 RepID=UPI00104B2F71|nr:hypothetical protein [Rhizobium sp. BK376]TCR76750.1 hypothetical protein EV561_11910 [Rhizobium sp. BK376]